MAGRTVPAHRAGSKHGHDFVTTALRHRSEIVLTRTSEAGGCPALASAEPNAKNQSVLRKDAKIELLRRVPLFDRCSKRELQEVASVADELRVPEGRILTIEAKHDRDLIVIVEGAADVRRKGRKIATLGSGDFLGEIALVTARPRTATVTTTAPSQLLVITERDFRDLMRRTPSITFKVLEAVSARLPLEP
jgi:CRP/FNR family cyclic AMP-dependent transcriptional regulator